MPSETVDLTVDSSPSDPSGLRAVNGTYDAGGRGPQDHSPGDTLASEAIEIDDSSGDEITVVKVSTNARLAKQGDNSIKGGERNIHWRGRPRETEYSSSWEEAMTARGSASGTSALERRSVIPEALKKSNLLHFQGRSIPRRFKAYQASTGTTGAGNHASNATESFQEVTYSLNERTDDIRFEHQNPLFRQQGTKRLRFFSSTAQDFMSPVSPPVGIVPETPKPLIQEPASQSRTILRCRVEDHVVEDLSFDDGTYWIPKVPTASCVVGAALRTDPGIQEGLETGEERGGGGGSRTTGQTGSVIYFKHADGTRLAVACQSKSPVARCTATLHPSTRSLRGAPRKLTTEYRFY